MKYIIKNHLKKTGMLFIFLLLIILTSTSTKGNSDIENLKANRILYISSYSPSFMTFNDQLHGIKRNLANTNTIIDIEYMDTKRVYTQESLNLFYQSLSYKLTQLPPYDIIVVADDNALNFILDYQNELFENTPIIFMGINNIENAILASENSYITGVVEDASIKETIEIASKLNSTARKVVALVDNTTSGQADLVNYYELKNEFDNLEFTDIDLSHMDFDTFKEELSQLTSNDIVLLLSVYQDSTGETIPFNQGLQIVLDNCSQPIYHPYFHGLNDGILGGKVISHVDQGRAVSDIILKIYDGEHISNIPLIDKSPNRYYFNYNALSKYDIDASLLPDDTIILNKKPTFFEAYYPYIIATLIVIIIQLIFIVFLRLNIRKRKGVEKALQLKEENLLETNTILVSTNDSLIATNKELTTALKEIQMQDQKIYELIYIDSLSGLKNRYAMSQHIDIMTNTQTISHNLSILFIDIDNFKNINDTYGHEVGDKVIKIISTILSELNDESITVGRFGGDEFLIVIKDSSNEHFLQEVIQHIQKQLSTPLSIDNLNFYLTVSIGVTHYPKDGKNLLELLRKADIALYQAKNLGKNRAVLYTETLNKAHREKFLLHDAIIKGINNEEFHLNYQPYIDPVTKKIVGLEALIRWQSPDFGYVSPYKLITTAEEMGVISQISDWVLKKACLFAKDINNTLGTKLTVSINISPYQLSDQNFFENTMHIINSTGVDYSLICLEMTETLLIKSIEKETDAIEKLHNEGIRIAIDDFGTGYSSLKYFKDLPASVIKIDKSFIDDIDKEGFEYHLIDAITQLAHQRNMSVVAEGVERESQLITLEKLSCDLIQGFLFSKPLSEKDAIKFIKKSTNNF